MSLITRLRRLFTAIVLALPLMAAAQTADKPYTSEQLDQMLAQIALYPDSLLSQVLMAATYPDEFQQAVGWSKSNPDAKGDDAVKMVESKGWDPSVASLVAFPEVLITLGEKPDYVKNLGDAFLAQPEDVMNSVQRLRAAAQKAGNLKSNEQIKVSVDPTPPLQQAATAPSTTTVVQAPPVTQTIIIEPAQPQVVYVPQYNPAVVYGPWWYPSYPPYYYPPPVGYWWSPVGGAVARGIAWGAGFAVGNALWGGCNWGRGDVDINVNRYNNINVNNRIEGGGNRSNWSHNTNHRQTSYRGGDAQRQNLQNKSAATNRQQYRGKEGGANRDASRAQAQQAMQQRGVDPGSGSARDRAQSVDRSQVDRAQAQQRAQSTDRGPAATAQSADRGATQQRSHDNALRGADSSQARAQQARGSSSYASAQRTSGGGGQARAVAGAAPAVAAAAVDRPVQVAAAAVEPAAVAVAAVGAAVVVAAVAVDSGERTDMKNHKKQFGPLRAALATVLLTGTLAMTPHAQAQQAYPTPEAAANALIDGIARHDPDQVKAVLGADYAKYIPVRGSAPEDTTAFLEAWARGHRIVSAGGDKAMVEVGTRGWTMPIPIVKTAAGWKFDTRAAVEEMRMRRVGRNELAAIQASLAYVDAQREYAARDWDGDGVKSYAMRALSTPGKRDGLYWPSLPNEPESPLGPAFAEAKVGQPFHGYAYRILTAQGPAAPGGAKSYVRNGRMTEGFALIAWPAKYADTGVMTFIVSQDGVVYEKDLGPGTGSLAPAVKAFDPGAGWQKADVPKP